MRLCGLFGVFVRLCQVGEEGFRGAGRSRCGYSVFKEPETKEAAVFPELLI